MKLRSDRALSAYLDSGIRGFRKGAEKTMSDLYAGVERASWYSSCVFPEYQDICRSQFSEDMRMITCIKEFLHRTDAILDMLVLCVDYVLSHYNEQERQNIIGAVLHQSDYCYSESDDIYSGSDIHDSAHVILKNENFVARVVRECNLSSAEISDYSVMATAGGLAMLRTSDAVRRSVAYAIAKATSESLSLSMSIRGRLNSVLTLSVNILNFYGIVQQAASAARRLQQKNREYYDILYANQLEMFFFFVEGQIPEEFYYPSLISTDAESTIRILQGIMK
ncbi:MULTISPECIES: hypothetical protein [Enterobacterales]|uniref:hypothetical protein n=1 Tax=Enterobacterales TaxID=91347 RepID=UPI002EDB0DF7